MTYWQSPTIPSHIDKESFLATVYAMFYDYSPKKSGHMASGIDYTVTGDSSYWWDDVIYAGYQDTVTKYAGWWHEGLPRRWDSVLSTWDSSVELQDSDIQLVNDILKQYGYE